MKGGMDRYGDDIEALARGQLAFIRLMDKGKKREGKAGAKLRQHINLCAIELLQDCGVADAVIDLFDHLLGNPIANDRAGLPHAFAWDAVMSFDASNPKASNLACAKVFAAAISPNADYRNYTKQVRKRRQSDEYRKTIESLRRP